MSLEKYVVSYFNPSDDRCCFHLTTEEDLNSVVTKIIANGISINSLKLFERINCQFEVYVKKSTLVEK